mmetsp:Transcript_17992/g.44643  ORF Transcript_17992/g.44643 Transcript_17992/m.44643 type:complete len:329 (-) Transcript_17992:1337-2323(-)
MRHLDRLLRPLLVQHLDEAQGAGGDEQRVAELGEHVGDEVQLVLLLTVDVPELRQPEDQRVLQPRHDLGSDDGEDAASVRQVQVRAPQNVQQRPHGVVDDVHKAALGHDHERDVLHPRAERDHHSAQDHELVHQDELHAVHRRVCAAPRAALELPPCTPGHHALFAVPDLLLLPLLLGHRGEGEGVHVLHQQQQHGRGERPLQLPQPAEGHRAVGRLHHDVPVVAHIHLVVRVGRHRADERHLKVEPEAAGLQAEQRGVQVHKQRRHKYQGRHQRVHRLHFVGALLGARNSVVGGSGGADLAVQEPHLAVHHAEQREHAGQPVNVGAS